MIYEFYYYFVMQCRHLSCIKPSLYSSHSFYVFQLKCSDISLTVYIVPIYKQSFYPVVKNCSLNVTCSHKQMTKEKKQSESDILNDLSKNLRKIMTLLIFFKIY